MRKRINGFLGMVLPRWSVAVAAVFFQYSLHAAPGGAWNTIPHIAYPTPQDVMATLDGSKVKLAWDGVAWPAEGWATEIDGKTVPTDFTYGVECRVKDTGTDTWSEWWERTSRSRLDANGVFVSRWEIEDDVESGKTYQYRIRCYSYIQPENPHLLTNPTRDGYFSDYSDTVTASKTLDKLIIGCDPDQNPFPLQGMMSITVTNIYTSTREAEGKRPLFFTFKAIEVPYPAPGTATEAPAVGSKPIARRDGKTLEVKTLEVTPPDSLDYQYVDSTSFTLMAASDTMEYPGEINWHVDKDLPNYYHTNVTILVQGWEPSETEGGKPRLVLDEAIGDLTIDTRHLTAESIPERDGILLTWPDVPGAVKYEVWLAKDGYGEDELLTTTTETTYTHTAVQPRVRYPYRVKALDAAGGELDSCRASGYSRYDIFSMEDGSLVAVQPQTPWNGKVDFLLKYETARDTLGRDGFPRFKLFVKKGGEPVEVKTLRRSVGEPYDEGIVYPDDFSLYGTKPLNRLEWDAGTDLGTGTFDDLTFSIECVRVE